MYHMSTCRHYTFFSKILGVPGTKGAKSRVAQGVGVEYFFGGSTYPIET